MNKSKNQQTLRDQNKERDDDQTLVKKFEAQNLEESSKGSNEEKEANGSATPNKPDDKAEEKGSSMPWRPFGRNGDWTPEYRTYLKNEVKESEVKQELQSARFLILGPVGSGKSSFINSVASVDQDRIADPVQAGISEKSFTFKFKLYAPKKHLKNFTLGDTMGFCDYGDFTIQDLNYLLDGHVKPDYKLDQTTPIDVNDKSFFNKTPSLMEKIHCAALVFDSERIYFDYLSKEEKLNIKKIQETIRIKEVPTVIILTKIDKLCEDVDKDITNAHRSVKVQGLVRKAEDIFGIQPKNIFPVKNYTNESDTDVNKDILILLALKKMMDMATDYLAGK